jgi:hypothetical protein
VRHPIASAFTAVILYMSSMVPIAPSRRRSTHKRPDLPALENPARLRRSDDRPASPYTARSPYAAANANADEERLTGEDIGVVRPYILTPEERRQHFAKCRLREQRRAEDRLATYGVDLVSAMTDRGATAA